MNLHCHSEYSFQDGMAKVEDIAKKQKELGDDFFYITDHGTMASFPAAFEIAKKNDMKFIPGIEFYVTPPSKYDLEEKTKNIAAIKAVLRKKTISKEERQEAEQKLEELSQIPARRNFHITAISKSQTGFDNLIKIYNSGKTYYKYRVPLDSIKNFKEDIFVFSGCIGSELAFYIRNGFMDEAEEYVKCMKNTFGENFFIEIQFHGMDMSERELEENLLPEFETYIKHIELAKKFDVHMVATNDSHYIKSEDKPMHDLYEGICRPVFNKKTAKTKPGFSGTGYHMVSLQELKDRFSDAGYPDVDEIIGSYEKYIKPNIDPEQTIHTDNSFRECDEELAKLAWAGWESIRKGTAREEESKKRVEYELSIISEKKKSYYFIDVEEIVSTAKSLNIMTGPGRGSAAGSEVAYLIGITKTDPLKYGLMFERFMNPARFEMPDIDVDFESKLEEYDDRQGSEVVCEHLKDKFVFQGSIENVVTASKISLFKKLGSYLEIPFSDCNKFTTTEYTKDLLNNSECIPDETVFIDALNSIGIKYSDKWKTLYDNLNLVYDLDGIVFGSSIHASGKIMSRNNVLLPINDAGVVNFNGTNLEKYGYTKYDLLSVDSLNAIKAILGIDLDWQDVYDPKVFEMMRTGDTDFVFQLGGGIPKQMLKDGSGDNIEEISEISAINRPGPLGMNLNEQWIDVKNNRFDFNSEEAKIVSKVLKDAFGDSHSGFIVYQEDVMRLAVDGCGFTLTEADLLRKSIGKKKMDLLQSFKDKFIQNWKFGGNPSKIWDDLEAFARYAFNKSHAVSYSIVSYFTAYLWLYHKEEYLEWMMNYNSKKKVAALAACQKLGIHMSFPSFEDCEKSDKYRVKNHSVYFPVEYDGKYSSLSDLVFGDVSLSEKLYFINSGSIDHICIDRKGLYDLVNEMPEKNRVNYMFPTSRTVPELLEYGHIANLWDYTDKGPYYEVMVNKARSQKKVIIYKSRRNLPDIRLQNNISKDVKYFGFHRPGSLSMYPNIEGNISLRKFEILKDKLTHNENGEVILFDNPYEIKNKLSAEVATALRDSRAKRFIDDINDQEFIVEVRECVYVQGRAYASLTLGFDQADVKFYPRDKALISKVQKLNKKDICRVKLKFDYYVSKNLEPIFMLKIQDIWVQEEPKELGDM